MNRNVLSALGLLFFTICFSQEPVVRGKVSVAILNEQTAALENATVELLRSKDSGLVKSALTDKNGIAEMENIKAGAYFLKATMVGYSAAYSPLFDITAEKPAITISSIALVQKAVNELQGVQVTL